MLLKVIRASNVCIEYLIFDSFKSVKHICKDYIMPVELHIKNSLSVPRC